LLIRADFIARQQRNDGKSPEMPILEEMRRLDVPRELGFADMISGADKREHVADPRMRGVDGMRDTLGEARCMKIQCRARLDLQGAAHIEVEPRQDRQGKRCPTQQQQTGGAIVDLHRHPGSVMESPQRPVAPAADTRGEKIERSVISVIGLDPHRHRGRPDTTRLLPYLLRTTEKQVDYLAFSLRFS
jgi:hypothetical protein